MEYLRRSIVRFILKHESGLLLFYLSRETATFLPLAAGSCSNGQCACTCDAYVFNALQIEELYALIYDEYEMVFALADTATGCHRFAVLPGSHRVVLLGVASAGWP